MRNPCRPGLALTIGIAVLSAAAETSLATPVDPEILARIEPRKINPARASRNIIENGRRLFFEETFDGNGRTCGTCHPATNNFTIDEEFIEQLPAGDPLFVDVPGLEIEGALEKGLILEHLDTFDNPGVLRGVPHNLAMRTTMNSNLPGIPEATGWSGDGSPDGTLRHFTVGAVIQHLTRSTDRVPDVDFRLPTGDELDAMEAFMLSVGRQQDVDLEEMSFADPEAEAGRELFLKGTNRSCNGCHRNAGANNSSGVNANFDTGTRKLTVIPLDAELFGPDAGLGRQPHNDGGFGNGTMNVPPLIEAADTAPFFHNNSAETLEDAIRFYTSPVFGASPAGQNGDGAFDLTDTEIDRIGAALRMLNSLENIRNGIAVAELAQRSVPALARARVEEVMAETEDAIQVLRDGPLTISSDAISLLEQALALEREARTIEAPPRRNALLNQAIALKTEARGLILASSE